MAPQLTGIDHIHVFVSDRVAAEDWYRRVLGDCKKFCVLSRLIND
jgi:catechol-2,3-dioxygenase